MNKVNIHTGNIDDMGRRFTDAWKRAAAGKRVNETHLTFLDLESMLATLSPKRLALLRYMRSHGPSSIKALAAALERDYKNVHSDVQALLATGLLEKEGARIVAPWDRVSAEVELTSKPAVSGQAKADLPTGIGRYTSGQPGLVGRTRAVLRKAASAGGLPHRA